MRVDRCADVRGALVAFGRDELAALPARRIYAHLKNCEDCSHAHATLSSGLSQLRADLSADIDPGELHALAGPAAATQPPRRSLPLFVAAVTTACVLVVALALLGGRSTKEGEVPPIVEAPFSVDVDKPEPRAAKEALPLISDAHVSLVSAKDRCYCANDRSADP